MASLALMNGADLAERQERLAKEQSYRRDLAQQIEEKKRRKEQENARIKMEEREEIRRHQGAMQQPQMEPIRASQSRRSLSKTDTFAMSNDLTNEDYTLSTNHSDRKSVV